MHSKINAGAKALTERTGRPVFQIVVEMETANCVRIYDSARAVDAILSGSRVESELRWRTSEGRIFVQQESALPRPEHTHAADELVEAFLLPGSSMRKEI